MTAPGKIFAAATVATDPDTAAVKVAGLVETAEFESEQVAVGEAMFQLATGVSEIVVAVFVANRMTGVPVTAVPAVAVVIVDVLVVVDQGVLAVLSTLPRTKSNAPTPPLVVF